MIDIKLRVLRGVASLETLALALLGAPASALADDQALTPPPSTATLSETPEQPATPAEVIVHGERSGNETASRVEFGRRELELRPRLRPGDVVEAVPGLFAVQHAGGGKANQYFLRGFDADHGTDVAFFVDGVPVNMVSHGHGQGFSDLHFLIPELVVTLDGYKGPYYAHVGDFATAGAVNLHLAEAFDESSAQYTIGQYGIMRGLAIASPKLGDSWRAIVAGEVYKDDGPFLNPERLTRFNVFARLTHALDERSKVALTWTSYSSMWNGSGQIPARAVCGEGEAGNPPPSAFGQPCIDHFGNVDPTEGGQTQRHMVSVSFSSIGTDSDVTALFYLMQYRFTLFSNFTFFKDDPVNGDQIEQDDSRVVGGADVRVRKHVHFLGSKFMTTVGMQARADSIANALRHDRARTRLEDRVSADIGETEVGLFAEEDAALGKYVRLILGARADRIDVNVDDRLGGPAAARPNESGIQGAALFSPKVMAVVSPMPELDLFVDYGRGFHSNDARGAVQKVDPAALMTVASGYEVGARVRPVDSLTLSAAGFLLDLDSELVWSGDEGTTEPSRATRRYGLEIEGRYHLGSWLFADADATFTHAAFRVNAGNGEAVALAPRRTFSAGIGARRRLAEWTPFGAIRVKAIADRPAIEDGSLTAQGFTVVDANAGARWNDVELSVDVQNLLNAKWREVNFANESKLSYEPGAVTGVHYSPGWPRTIMARATAYWP